MRKDREELIFGMVALKYRDGNQTQGGEDSDDKGDRTS